MDSWSSYVRNIARDEPQDVVGRKIGVNGSTINRWRNGSRPGKPAEVAALAAVYGGNVLEAFVAAGFLTPEQAKVPPKARPDWDSVSDDELLEQVATRLAQAGGGRGRPDADEARLSGTTDSPGAIAAHEDVSITGEQESGGAP
jgi:DNA-binding transcriptional regulator YdaS (Cro superfamily)